VVTRAFWRGVRLAAQAVVCGMALAVGWRSGVVPTVLVLGGIIASVVLHEAGHLLAARCLGVKATQFFVGFGPTLWSRRSGEVSYGVKLLPLGGFVKLVGTTAKEKVDPEDEARTFRAAAPWRRAVIALAGPAVNAVMAVGLLFAFSLDAAPSPAAATRSTSSTLDRTVEASVDSIIGLPASTVAMARAAIDADSSEPANRVLSPIGAARLANQAVDDSLATALGLLAIINVFLALFNLLPLPPLDGGHIALAAFDRLGSVVLRRRVRIDAGVFTPVTAAVIIGLAILGLASMVLDVTRPIPNPFA
jgi:membrane-associated protease RseP (regulator of RpoE activity)